MKIASVLKLLALGCHHAKNYILLKKILLYHHLPYRLLYGPFDWCVI